MTTKASGSMTRGVIRHVNTVADLSTIESPQDQQVAVVAGLTGFFVYNDSMEVWARKSEYYDNSASGLSAENQKDAIDEIASVSGPSLIKFLPSVSEQVTVGSGGDYATLNEALEYFSKKYPTYKSGGIYGEVLLLSGFVLAEEIHLINGVDLGWVRISSQDAEVTITRSAITTPFVDYEPIVNVPLSSDRRACFYALNNSTLPQINTLFDMDASGAQNNVYGISVQWNSSVTVSEFCGVKNADRGLEVQINSRAQAYRGDFKNSVEVGLRVGNASTFHGPEVDVSGSATGTSLGNLATAHIEDIVASGCNVGLNADNARFYADGGDFTNATASAVQCDLSTTGTLDNADLSGSGNRGLYLQPNFSGSISAVNATIDLSTGNGVEMSSGNLNIASGTITNSGDRGIECTSLGKCSAYQATVSGSTNDDLVVLRGGQILITGGTTTSGSPATADTNVGAFNAISGNSGIIWN